jgi:hypothetical protein
VFSGLKEKKEKKNFHSLSTKAMRLVKYSEK